MQRRIVTRQDLNYFIACDEAAYGQEYSSRWHRIELMLFKEKQLGLWFTKKNRRLEYWFNASHRSPFHKLMYLLKGYSYVKLQYRFGCSIPLNVIGPGFRIWHFGQGSIIINDKAVVGRAFSISANCVIGQAKEQSPNIGDGVEMCVNATVLGDVSNADQTVIGANSLVIKDIVKRHTTVVGSPSRQVSEHYPQYNVSRLERVNAVRIPD
jgi:serine O-acetyltransferase